MEVSVKMIFCYSRNYFKKHWQIYKIVTDKIFAKLNSSRQHKILMFFTLACWVNMGRVITQTRRQSLEKLFKHLTDFFQTVVQDFGFILRFQTFDQASGRIKFLKIWPAKSTIYSLKYNLILQSAFYQWKFETNPWGPRVVLFQ